MLLFTKKCEPKRQLCTVFLLHFIKLHDFSVKENTHEGGDWHLGGILHTYKTRYFATTLSSWWWSFNSDKITFLSPVCRDGHNLAVKYWMCLGRVHLSSHASQFTNTATLHCNEWGLHIRRVAAWYSAVFSNRIFRHLWKTPKTGLKLLHLTIFFRHADFLVHRTSIISRVTSQSFSTDFLSWRLLLLHHTTFAQHTNTRSLCVFGRYMRAVKSLENFPFRTLFFIF